MQRATLRPEEKLQQGEGVPLKLKSKWLGGFKLRADKHSQRSKKRRVFKIYVPLSIVEVFETYAIYLKLTGVKSMSGHILNIFKEGIRQAEGTQLWRDAGVIYQQLKKEEIERLIKEGEQD